MSGSDPRLEHAFREQWGRVLAALIGFLGDFDLAQEAAQEAFAIAAQRWPRDGAPEHPGGWLLTTARNRAINRIRRDRTLAAKTRLLEVAEGAEDTMTVISVWWVVEFMGLLLPGLVGVLNRFRCHRASS